MHRATKITELPALTADFLHHSGLLMDNVFASLWKQIGMKPLLRRAGFRKRSGTAIDEVVYTLILWIWLNKTSIGWFARECLQDSMGKDVLYDTMNREDLNWRNYHQQVAVKAVAALKPSGKSAFVVDDTIRQRFGKKMPGVSSHFDHSSGRHVMGQQVVTLGLSGEEGFVPLDSELFISQSNAQDLQKPFRDGRSTVAKRYRLARRQTKPEMVAAMIHRALRAGIMADYLLADAWFGSKTMIRLSQEASLTAILRMKKNPMKYRITEYRNGTQEKREMDIKALYKYAVRKAWEKIPGQPYQVKTIDVTLNLAENDKAPEQWVNVRLLFVRGAVDTAQSQCVF